MMNKINKHIEMNKKDQDLIISEGKTKKIFWKDLFIVLIISIGLHTIFSLRSFSDPEHRQMEQDSIGYLTLANNLVKGEGFARMKPVGPQGQEVFTPEFCRTPGYPLLIAGFQWLTGDGLKGTIIFQQILGVILCLMVMFTCQRYFGRKAGLVAGSLLALDLQAIGLSNILYADFIFSFILCCSVLLLVKNVEGGNIWYILGAGLLLGFGILTKPAGMPLPIILSFVLIFYAIIKHQWRLVTTALFIFFVAYMPVFGWMIRNGIVCGEYSFCSQPKHFLLQIAMVSLGRAEGISNPVARDKILAGTGVNYVQIRQTAILSDEANKVKKAAIGAILNNKSSFMKEWEISSAKLFFGPEKMTLLALGLPHIAFGIQGDATAISNTSSVISIVILAFETFILGVTYILVFMTVYKCIKMRLLPNIVLFCLMVTLPILVLSTIPGGGDPRYRFGVIPLLVVIAAAGFGLNKLNVISAPNSKGYDTLQLRSVLKTGLNTNEEN